jgi:hypothetical protein
MSMGKAEQAVTRSETLTPRELPLPAPNAPPPLAIRPPPPGPGARIREKLRRWLEEEM